MYYNEKGKLLVYDSFEKTTTSPVDLNAMRDIVDTTYNQYRCANCRCEAISRYYVKEVT